MVIDNSRPRAALAHHPSLRELSDTSSFGLKSYLLVQWIDYGLVWAPFLLCVVPRGLPRSHGALVALFRQSNKLVVAYHGFFAHIWAIVKCVPALTFEYRQSVNIMNDWITAYIKLELIDNLPVSACINQFIHIQRVIKLTLTPWLISPPPGETKQLTADLTARQRTRFRGQAVHQAGRHSAVISLTY